MAKIILETARNGIIKKIFDDNSGGSNMNVTYTDVYELEDDSKITKKALVKFLYELCEDLGLKVGNKFSSAVIDIDFTWGSHYDPTNEEIELKISELEETLELLKEINNNDI